MKETELTQTNIILKELNDIKVTLAVNSTKQLGIENSITEIKGDIKEIKNDFVVRREFNDALIEIRVQNAQQIKAVSDKIGILNRIVYAIGGAVGLTIIAQILKLIFK